MEEDFSLDRKMQLCFKYRVKDFSSIRTEPGICKRVQMSAGISGVAHYAAHASGVFAKLGH